MGLFTSIEVLKGTSILTLNVTLFTGSLPIVLLLSTIATLIVSWLITKSGPLRYFFGLPTKKDSMLPGKALGGMLPTAVLLVLFVTVALIANLL